MPRGYPKHKIAKGIPHKQIDHANVGNAHRCREPETSKRCAGILRHANVDNGLRVRKERDSQKGDALAHIKHANVDNAYSLSYQLEQCPEVVQITRLPKCQETSRSRQRERCPQVT